MRSWAPGGHEGVATDLDAPRHTGDTIVNAVLDVTDGDATERLVAEVEQRDGPIAIWFANAGVARGGSYDAPDAWWDLQWRVNVMAHVHASRALVPRWIERGEGHLVTTASMAGILTTLGDGVYAATKHAAVGFAEWMAITYADRGVKVSCVCPGAVDTPMLRGTLGDPDKADSMIGGGGAISADEAAARVLEGVRRRPLPDPHASCDARVHDAQGRRPRPMDPGDESPVDTQPRARGRRRQDALGVGVRLYDRHRARDVERTRRQCRPHIAHDQHVMLPPVDPLRISAGVIFTSRPCSSIVTWAGDVFA